MASTRTLRAMRTVVLLLLFGATMLAAPPRAQADDDAPKPSTRFPRFRVAGSAVIANIALAGFGASGNNLSVSYDFCRLSHLPGGSGDPAALSVYVESEGDNPFHSSYGSSLFGGITVRTPARPVYVQFGLGLSHDTLYDDDDVYDYDSGQSTPRRTYAPAARVGFRLFFGLDVPRTPLFVEVGGGFDSGVGTNFGTTGGAGLRFGIRL